MLIFRVKRDAHSDLHGHTLSSTLPSFNNQNWWESSSVRISNNYTEWWLWRSLEPCNYNQLKKHSVILPHYRLSSWTRKSMQQNWISCFDLQRKKVSPVQWSSSPIRPGVASRWIPDPRKQLSSHLLTFFPRKSEALSFGGHCGAVLT